MYQTSELDEESLNFMENHSKAESTSRSTKWGVKKFYEWLLTSNKQCDFATISSEDFSSLLKKYYSEVMPQKPGSTLTPSSLTGLRAALHRHVTSEPFNRQFNILHDKEFITANNMFVARCKLYFESNNVRPKHKTAIDDNDMKKLGQYFRRYTQDAEVLQESLWFYLCYSFGKRGRDGWTSMNKETFELRTDADGIEYVSMSLTEETKNHQGGFKRADIDYSTQRMYGEGVAIYKFNLAKLSDKCDRLFQRPKQAYSPGDTWYVSCPLGKNVLSCMMQRISKRAGLSREYTGHCVCASTITMLYQAGVNPQSIINITNHKNAHPLTDELLASQIKMANPTGNVPMVIPVAGYQVIRSGDQSQFVTVQSGLQPPVVQPNMPVGITANRMAHPSQILTPVSGIVTSLQTTIKQEPSDSGYERARLGVSEQNASKTPVSVQQVTPTVSESQHSAGDAAEPLADKLSRIAALADNFDVKKLLNSMLDSKNRDVTVRNFIENSLQKNEDLLAKNDAIPFKPTPRVIRKDIPKEVLPWPAAGSIAFQITNSSVGKLSDKEKNYSSAENIKNPAGTILRPRSPTRNCSIADKDKTHFSLAAVEKKILDKEADELFSVSSHELVCALTSNVKFVAKGSSTCSEVDIVQYWCNFCPFKTESKALLMSHVITHRFHCRYCTYQSFARSDVVQHTKSKHAKEFETAAQSLRYMTLLPDYLQVKVLQSGKTAGKTNTTKKRKLSLSLYDDTLSKKKAVVDEEESVEEECVENENDVCTEQENAGHTGQLVTKDEEYDYFDMEVDEIEDEAGPSDSVETEPMVIIPARPIAEISSTVVGDSTKLGTKPSLIVPQSVTTTTIKPTKPMVVQSPSPGKVGNPQMSSAVTQTTLVSSPLVTGKPGTISSVSVVSVAPPAISTVTLTTPKPASSVQPATNSKSLSVAKNLCWTCGYCDFVSVSQSQLKNHLNLEHRGKAHKYVAMLVNSKGETTIKDDDSRSGTDSLNDPKETVSQTLKNPVKKLASSPLDVDDLDYDSDSQSSDDGDDGKKAQNSYKCAHCKFHSHMYTPVKDHLLDKHQGCLMYAIDMRAIAQRKARYVFFCLKRHCIFHSKRASSFVDHAKSCTPWDNEDNNDDIASHRKQSLVLTLQFASKIKNKTKQLNETKDPSQAAFKCSYCVFKSSTLKKVKQHIFQHHEDKQIVVVDTKMKQMKDKFIFVCKYCDFQGPSAGDLTKHVENDCMRQNKSDSGSDVEVDTESNVPDDSDSAILESDSSQNLQGDDVDFTESDVEKMMADYLEDENKKHETTPGRPLRASAFKAQIKCRVQDPPPMYRCRYCMFHVFGTNLMRHHIDQEHNGKSMSALDVKKKHNKRSYLIFFCRKTGCSFKSPSSSEVDKHAVDAHQIKESVRKDNDDFKLQEDEDTDDSIPDISNTKSLPSKTNGNDQQADLQVYNCQYCNFTANAIPKLKFHLSDKHPNEEYVFQDMSAFKRNVASTVYACRQPSCLFHTTVSREIDLHNHAHERTNVYECSDCRFFHVNQADVLSHMATEHARTSVSRLTMVLLNVGDDCSTIKTETSVKLEVPDVH